MSNKTVALTAIGSWALMAVISFIDGYVYGFPATGSILPSYVLAIFGWISFGATVYALYRLLRAPDSTIEIL